MSPYVSSKKGRKTRRISRQRSFSPPVRRDEDRQEPSHASFFPHAQDFVVNGGQFKLTQTNHYVNDSISNRTAVFEMLKPYTCLGATKDSSARHPPPRCHPGTREKIRERLMRWLVNEYDEWKMLWVRGFAGTGKSAVAQSFADSCEEEGILGGTYFFFRAAGMNKFSTVIPTLIYQLASNVTEYQSLIERRLARDPSLLENSPPVQFRKLIIEPFAALQRERPRNPIAVILDGLDECEGEHAQREVIDMITDAIRTNPDLPLRWLIFSRPEAHLKNAFSRKAECGREELVIDAECRENVERYVRDEVIKIKAVYNDVTPVDWPPRAKLQGILDKVDGLFVLASTCVNYIGDPEEADPASQLDRLLTFMRRLQGVVSRNPLVALDLLYLQILECLPSTVLKTTGRILACLSLQIHALAEFWFESAQVLSNFLRLDQQTFYRAMRGLHSVMRVPDPEDAARCQLQFHHASFQDFLLDPLRSGKFTIDKHAALVDTLLSAIHWYEIDVQHFHTNGDWHFGFCHEHGCLPGLTWASDSNRQPLSRSIMNFIQFNVFSESFPALLNRDENLLAQALNINFRYWPAHHVSHFARICQLDPSTSIIRVTPTEPMDLRLREYFNFNFISLSDPDL